MFDKIYEYACSKSVSKVGLQIHTGEKLKKYKNDEFKKVTGVAIDKKHRLKVMNAKGEELKRLFSQYSENFEDITKKDRKTAINKIRAIQLIEPKIFQPSLDKLLKVAGI